MRIVDLVSMGKEYLVLGVFAIFVIMVITFIVYKCLLKGKKKINPIRILGWLFLGSYIVIILGATLFGRAELWEKENILPLFYSYRDAWVNFSVTAWRNLILNVCMFVPLGVLLPLMIKFFRSFWKTYLAGFFFTLCIEGIQLFGKRGIFELDDILHNTVGMMIGYGIYAIGTAIIQKYKSENISWKKTLSLQLPLVICVIWFSAIFISYNNKELGNVSGQYIVTYDKDKLEVKSECKYSKEAKKVPVYQFKIWSREDTTDFAEKLLQKLGTKLDTERNDFYEDTAVFYGEDQKNLWIDYAGGTYDLNEPFSEEKKVKTDISEKEVRKVLETYDIVIPKKAVFSKKEGRYTFTVEQQVEKDGMLDGTISGELSEEEKILELNYGLKKCKPYKSFVGISEQEAFEQICSGKFWYPYGREDNLFILVKECKIGYETDSKGYYQPVYLFDCEINGEKNEIKIPILQ